MNSSERNSSEYEDTNQSNTESSNIQNDSNEQDNKNIESLFESQNSPNQSSEDDLMSLFANSGMLENNPDLIFNPAEIMSMGEETGDTDLFDISEMMLTGEETDLFNTPEITGETSEMDLFNTPEMMSIGETGDTDLFNISEMMLTGEETELFNTPEIMGETSEMDLFNTPEMMSMGETNEMDLFNTPEMMSMGEETELFNTPEIMGETNEMDLFNTPEMMSMGETNEMDLFNTPEMMSMGEETELFNTPEIIGETSEMDLLATPEMMSMGEATDISQSVVVGEETSEIDLLAYQDLITQTNDTTQFTEVTATESELDSIQQPEIAEETNNLNLGLVAATGVAISLLEERLTVDVNKQKIGEVVVRKEIETEMIQVPVRREKLIVEQVGEKTVQLAEIDLGHSEIQGVELAANTAQAVTQATSNEMIVIGEFTSAKIVSLLLNAIALERRQGCKKIRIEIVVDDAERQQTYQEWVDRCSLKPSQK